MALKDLIRENRHRVFMNMGHFASQHTWNGIPFICVTDEETAMKRKNNNVVDVSWDNNTREIIIYVPEEDFPGRAVPNEHGWFDNMNMKILQVNSDMGMLTILLVAMMPRSLNDEDV